MRISASYALSPIRAGSKPASNASAQMRSLVCPGESINSTGLPNASTSVVNVMPFGLSRQSFCFADRLYEIVWFNILHVQRVGITTFVIERLKDFIGLAVRTGWAGIILQTLVVFPTLFAVPKTLKALIQYI